MPQATEQKIHLQGEMSPAALVTDHQRGHYKFTCAEPSLPLNCQPARVEVPVQAGVRGVMASPAETTLPAAAPCSDIGAGGLCVLHWPA